MLCVGDMVGLWLGEALGVLCDGDGAGDADALFGTASSDALAV